MSKKSYVSLASVLGSSLAIVVLILAAIFVPCLFIWCLNVLTPWTIPYTLTTWFAAFIITACFM